MSRSCSHCSVSKLKALRVVSIKISFREFNTMINYNGRDSVNPQQIYRWHHGTRERRDVIQKVLDKLQEQSKVNIITLKKAKYKHLEWGNLQYQYRLRNKWIQGILRERDMGLMKMWSQDSNVCSPVSSSHPGFHFKKYGQQIEGSDSPPLLCTCDTPPEYWLQLWGPQYKILNITSSRSREASQK